MTICFASHNLNKVREIAEIAPQGVEIVGLDELGVTEEIPETGDTLEENSRLKARYVFEKFNTAVFADDTGLEVSALGGEPGVISARYAGPERNADKNIDLLLKNLQPHQNKSAQFRTIITYITDRGEQHQFEGVMPGQIVMERRGQNGFGYDPVFTPEGRLQTFAEMSSEEKNLLSHRAKAFQKLLSYLEHQNE